MITIPTNCTLLVQFYIHIHQYETSASQIALYIKELIPVTHLYTMDLTLDMTWIHCLWSADENGNLKIDLCSTYVPVRYTTMQIICYCTQHNRQHSFSNTNRQKIMYVNLFCIWFCVVWLLWRIICVTKFSKHPLIRCTLEYECMLSNSVAMSCLHRVSQCWNA